MLTGDSGRLTQALAPGRPRTLVGTFGSWMAKFESPEPGVQSKAAGRVSDLWVDSYLFNESFDLWIELDDGIGAYVSVVTLSDGDADDERVFNGVGLVEYTQKGIYA